MRYKTRKGIVMTSVCGQYILVSAKMAREHCPYITQINVTTAICWKLLEEGSTADELAQHILKEFEVEDTSRIKGDISGLLEQLLEGGYIIETDER